MIVREPIVPIGPSIHLGVLHRDEQIARSQCSFLKRLNLEIFLPRPKRGCTLGCMGSPRWSLNTELMVYLIKNFRDTMVTPGLSDDEVVDLVCDAHTYRTICKEGAVTSDRCDEGTDSLICFQFSRVAMPDVQARHETYVLGPVAIRSIKHRVEPKDNKITRIEDAMLDHADATNQQFIEL